MPLDSTTQQVLRAYIKSMHDKLYPNLKYVKVAAYDKYKIVYYADQNAETVLTVFTETLGKYTEVPEMKDKFVMANNEPIYIGD